MKETYIEFLRNEVMLEIQPPYKMSGMHHYIKCLLCEHVFIATPKYKKANFNKHGNVGCSKCTAEASIIKRIQKRLICLRQLPHAT